MFMKIGVNSSIDEINKAEAILKERNYPTNPEKLLEYFKNING